MERNLRALAGTILSRRLSAAFAKSSLRLFCNFLYSASAIRLCLLNLLSLFISMVTQFFLFRNSFRSARVFRLACLLDSISATCFLCISRTCSRSSSSSGSVVSLEPFIAPQGIQKGFVCLFLCEPFFCSVG